MRHVAIDRQSRAVAAVRERPVAVFSETKKQQELYVQGEVEDNPGELIDQIRFILYDHHDNLFNVHESYLHHKWMQFTASTSPRSPCWRRTCSIGWSAYPSCLKNGQMLFMRDWPTV
jgi:hypothetical protein